MELLTTTPGSNERHLTLKLRMPVQSRLQKVHNVDLSLKTLRETASVPLSKSITSRDLVDGHREKTLATLWHLVLVFQLDKILVEDRLRQEIEFLEKSLRYR